MKKRIRGLMYNTDTAKLIYTDNSRAVRNSESSVVENLYRKKTGEFFIYGKGNSNTRYAKPVNEGESFKPGEGIIPLTYEEAKQWGKKNMPQAEYSRVFDYVSNSTDEITAGILISEQTNDMLKRIADKMDKNISKTLDSLVLIAYKNDQFSKFDEKLLRQSYPLVTNSRKKVFISVLITEQTNSILHKATEETGKTIGKLVEEIIITKFHSDFSNN